MDRHWINRSLKLPDESFRTVIPFSLISLPHDTRDNPNEETDFKVNPICPFLSFFFFLS